MLEEGEEDLYGPQALRVMGEEEDENPWRVHLGPNKLALTGYYLAECFFRMRRPVYRPPPLSRGGGGGGSRRPSRRGGGGEWRRPQRHYSSEWPAAAEAVRSTSKGKGKSGAKKGGKVAKKAAKGRSASRGGQGPTKMISRWEQI